MQLLVKMLKKLYFVSCVLCERIRILLFLIWNNILKLKLYLYKTSKGITHPIIHYYAICWNEEKMLPFMFQYYEKFVDEFFIYDNYSNDSTEAIINAHKNTHIIKFGKEGVLSDSEYLKIKNHVWKQSRGKADYVIMCDVDEFIYSTDIKNLIQKLYREKYTLIKPYGYDMYAESYPQYSDKECICDIVRQGKRYELFDKCILFDPHNIIEINYSAGCHTCRPTGIIKKYHNECVKLLHYKWLSPQYVIDRHHMYQQRLSKENIEKGWGMHYTRDEKTFMNIFNSGFAETSTII